MNNQELKEIIEQIKIGEAIKITAIAKKAEVNRSYLSSLINNEETIDVEPPFIGKIAKAFPAYFDKQQKPTNDLIMSSLKEIRGIAISILTGQSAGQEVIMGALDRLEEKPEGSLAAVAGRLALELAQRMNVIQKGNHEGTRRKGK